MCFLQYLIFLFHTLVQGFGCFAAEVYNFFVHGFNIFLDDFVTDNLDISDSVHASFRMSDLLARECSHYMEETVNLPDVRQELVAKSEAFGSTFHQTCNIDYSEDWSCDLFGIVELAKSFETWIFDSDICSVRIDGAKRDIFSRHVEIRQHIESTAFANISHTK